MNVPDWSDKIGRRLVVFTSILALLAPGAYYSQEETIAASSSLRNSVIASPMSVIPVGGNPIALAVDAPLGRIFVVSRPLDATGAASGRGLVSVLDAARGVVVCTFRVGVNPTDIVVDARAPRLCPEQWTPDAGLRSLSDGERERP